MDISPKITNVRFLDFPLCSIFISEGLSSLPAAAAALFMEAVTQFVIRKQWNSIAEFSELVFVVPRKNSRNLFLYYPNLVFFLFEVAGAVLTGYFSLIGFFVIKSKLTGKAPEEAPTKVVTSVAVSGDDLIPALDSPDFESFVGSEVRLGKFLESEERLMKWVDTLGE